MHFMKADSKQVANEPVNVAVVGLGFMGATHLRAYLGNSRARLAAVCDPSGRLQNGVLSGVSGNIQQTSEIKLGPDVRVYRDLESILEDSTVQLVDLCTPTAVHPEQVMAALRAGKHVLCEKPLARTSAAARRILEVAKNSSGMLMPAMCMRFWPGWAWLRQVVRLETYGKVLAARFRRVSEMPAWSRKGNYNSQVDSGGALFDLHIHDADFVNFLFGRPESVYATGVIDQHGSINHVVAQYQFFDGGPAVYAEGSWLLAKGFNMTYTVHCERATVDFDLSRGEDALQVTRFGQPTTSLPLGCSDGYGEEISYMLDCVANQRRPEVVTPRDGVAALEICEAEEQSVRTGMIVSVQACVEGIQTS